MCAVRWRFWWAATPAVVLAVLTAAPIGAQGHGDLYGDLYVLERDGNGVPLLDAMGCEQPIAADCSFVPLWWWEHPAPPALRRRAAEDEDPDPCDVDLELAAKLEAMPREVVLGRLNGARSPGQVLEHSYAEAIGKINTALDVRHDAAGRLELRARTNDGLLRWATIDSPLENMALYRTLMTQGCLPDLTPEAQALLASKGFGYLVPTQPPPEPVDDLDLLQAASWLAGAADKGGHVSLDAIVMINTLTGVNVELPDGSLELFDFGDYVYDRDVVYPPELEVYLLRLIDSLRVYAPDFREIGREVDFTSAQVCRDGVDVTGLGPEYGGADWFTEAAENARAVIWFLHNWSIPE